MITRYGPNRRCRWRASTPTKNFPLPVVLAFRSLGHEVLTSLDAGQANRKIPDDRVLAFASGDGRALLTLNRRDFMRLHRAGVSHQGIIACTVDDDHGAQAARIDSAVRALSGLAGQVRITKTT